MSNKTANSYHKELFEHFGFNFGFVADLMEKYFVDPNSVSDYWRNYFSEITGEEPVSKPINQK